jgi:hypothetical protein
MEGVSISDARTAEVERTTKPREGPRFRLLVGIFPRDDSREFAGEHRANAGAFARCVSPRLLKKALLYGKRDVLLGGHTFYLTRKIRELRISGDGTLTG